MRSISYRIDNDNSSDIHDYDKWTPEQLANFFAKAGLGQYHEVFLKHRISGRLAPLLTNDQLKEMGILIVGDRLRIIAIAQALGHKARYDKRTKTLWEGTEQLYFSECAKCFWTAGGCCPDDPSTYRLTSNHLRVKTVQPARCGPFRLCCSYQYNIDNLDLSKVNDVDIMGEPAPCCQRILCCAAGKDHVVISTPTASDGRMTLLIPQGEGEKVATMLLHQIEESQMIERDYRISRNPVPPKCTRFSGAEDRIPRFWRTSDRPFRSTQKVAHFSHCCHCITLHPVQWHPA